MSDLISRQLGSDNNVGSKDDLIDRAMAQAALMAKCERYTLSRESHGIGYVGWASDLISVADAMDALRELPSAQPEHKTGHWIIHDTLYGDDAYCSECHNSISVNQPGNGLPNVKDLCFCPYCGVRMINEGGEDE